MKIPIEKRFERFIDKSEKCWNWTGCRFPNGYGCFDKHDYAHRFSWKIYNGFIPKGMHVLHKCDVRECVNPKHLFLGTNADNMRDKIKKGRHLFGHKHPSSKLSEKDVIEIRRLRKTGLLFKEINKLFPQVKIDAIEACVRKQNWIHLNA